MTAEGQKADVPGYSRLLELLHGSYLRKGVRTSVARNLEETEARLQATKKRYLEHNLLHSELSAIFNHHPHNSSNREGGGREVLAAAEAQHCLRLHPDVPLLGVTPEHLRLTGGRPLSGSTKDCVLKELEERLRSKCLRVFHWHSGEGTNGSDSLQLAKAAQLPGVLTQQINQMDMAEVQLREKKEENARKMHQQYKILVETCEMLHGALEQARLGSMARAERVRLDYLQARCTALTGKQDVMYYQLLKDICSEGRLQALQEIRSLLVVRLRATEEQLTQTQHTLEHYVSLGPQLAALAQQYAATLAEIENKQWALNELQKSFPKTSTQ